MNERFLYFVWQSGLFRKENIKALTGETIDILRTGTRNDESGPDFFNAMIKINGITWAGNVEMHVKSSDWIAHKHSHDPAYKNVILHVVYEHDCPVEDHDGNTIPVVLLDFSKDLFSRYHQLIDNPNPIHCQGKADKTEPFRVKTFLTSLTVEKLHQKAQSIAEILKTNKNNWEETFYQLLARNFGFHVNSLPFEMLARSLPLQILSKHKNSQLQTEALLYGQSGLLGKTEIQESYEKTLIQEYNFLQKKYSLVPLKEGLWKFSRVRPHNFPTLRISQFAELLTRSFPLFATIIQAQNAEEIAGIFNLAASEYWDDHYSFQAESKHYTKNFGKVSFNNLVINSVAPFLFLYGNIKDEESYTSRAIELLESIPPEQNSVINSWKKSKIDAMNSSESQALLHLYKNYCQHHRCIECTIGSMIVIQQK